MVHKGGTGDANFELDLDEKVPYSLPEPGDLCVMILKDWSICPDMLEYIKEGGWNDLHEPEHTCYQCEKKCNYLFDDGRCYKCTRLTPEEVVGGYS